MKFDRIFNNRKPDAVAVFIIFGSGAGIKIDTAVTPDCD